MAASALQIRREMNNEEQQNFLQEEKANNFNKKKETRIESNTQIQELINHRSRFDQQQDLKRKGSQKMGLVQEEQNKVKALQKTKYQEQKQPKKASLVQFGWLQPTTYNPSQVIITQEQQEIEQSPKFQQLQQEYLSKLNMSELALNIHVHNTSEDPKTYNPSQVIITQEQKQQEAEKLQNQIVEDKSTKLYSGNNKQVQELITKMYSEKIIFITLVLFTLFVLMTCSKVMCWCCQSGRNNDETNDLLNKQNQDETSEFEDCLDYNEFDEEDASSYLLCEQD